MKKGLSMLTAIIFMLIIGLILSLTISLLSTNVSKTTQIYIYEQAKLLAQSATDYAVLAASAHPNNSCLNAVNFTYQNSFDINITLYYIGSGLPAGCNMLDNNLNNQESNKTLIIDTKVSLRPSLAQDSAPISYVKRTIQKL
ncbi:hypothetical protein [Nitratiruptor tergarcus]|uniref:Uncharacterized protein n=1 Tax=Nitratiruptor tergarcus DSM 16512 TaxID=1069081 RepID=A0A1W1WUU8_9BACT|nr:hypothetical protein [Nitratiruptor tergarcus]SMC10104.1 hypothetical protein SAMN05660197_1943 [Nitratiruptor tergarcus DSM 16512]